MKYMIVYLAQLFITATSAYAFLENSNVRDEFVHKTYSMVSSAVAGSCESHKYRIEYGKNMNELLLITAGERDADDVAVLKCSLEERTCIGDGQPFDFYPSTEKFDKGYLHYEVELFLNNNLSIKKSLITAYPAHNWTETFVFMQNPPQELCKP